jgi:1,2-dihydroxy-3-keto-5-methylthiopentene dioxygenase
MHSVGVQARGSYPTVDAIRMTPEHPDREALRQKFLAEHIHSEDEVRFFVDGKGLFCLHIGEEVLQVLCEADDWISVPAGTKHWFDMGSAPQFCAIRFFDNPDGWVAEFTGDGIAKQFPLLD